MPSNTIGNSVTTEFLVSDEVVVLTDVVLMDGRSRAWVEITVVGCG